jgi:ATP-binding cassette subfamily F protein 3
MEARVIIAQQLAQKRSGTRGHDARQAQLAIETEFATLKTQDPQVYISSDMATELITDVFDKFALINFDARKAKARKILRGLGFEEAQVDARVQTLSGGWRMQIALAKALFVGPDILLLDEPSMSFYITRCPPTHVHSEPP